MERGLLEARGRVVDPFGGIGGFGLVGGWHGLQMVLCELEERFVKLAEENFALHERSWDAKHPRPVIVQGDSRRLGEFVGPAVGR